MSEEMKHNEATETAEPAGKGSRKKLIPLIAAAVVILVAIAVGIFIYNTPANRISRQMDLGNRYLENEQYEEAILAFERVIAIDDRCIEAYAGAIKAYAGKGSQEELEAFYDRALAVVAELDEESVAQNMDNVVDIYLAADKVYETDPRKAAQILAEGYGKTGENGEIQEHLINDYLRAAENEPDAKKAAEILEDALAKLGDNQEIKGNLVTYYLKAAKEGTADASYEEALAVYDRLLELDSTNIATIKDLCSCLNQYIDSLMENRQYDTVRALAEKYGDVAADVDFAAVFARIEELERLEADNRAFMQKVYDLMAAEDYEGMHGVDGSEEAAAFVERMENAHYIYFPDDNESMSGIGAGVYLFDEGGYCFYYGTIENGERKGSGTEFFNNSSGGYYFFKGEWDKDAPNGAGVVTRVNNLSSTSGSRYSEMRSGNLVNGLWDGDVKCILTDLAQREDFDLSFSTENGVPTKDRTEEWLSEVWWEESPEEGKYIFAFDYHRNTDYGWWSYIGEGKTLGVAGFADSW